MSGYNNSLWYYKMYYEDQGDESINWLADSKDKDNEKSFQRRNDALFDSRFPSLNTPIFAYPAADGLDGFNLVTTYPGLLVGSGLAHGSGHLGELKLGFFLDYTTGLPVIPGSSVKGVLRSAFPAAYRAEGLNKKAGEVLQLCQYYLKEVADQDWPEVAVIALEEFLFGTFQPGKAKNPHPGQVVFHDAVPVNANRVRLNNQPTRRYLREDFITPHKNRSKHPNKVPDAFVNPVPVGFLKVLPGVEFRFQFELRTFAWSNDTSTHNLDKEQLADLLKMILLDLGTGAKSNVGYGRWEEPNGDANEPEANVQEEHRDYSLDQATTRRSANRINVTTARPSSPPPPDPRDKLPAQYHQKEFLDDDQELVGIIVKGSKKKPDVKRILFVIKDEVQILADDNIQSFALDDFVKVKVQPSSLKNKVARFSDPQIVPKAN